MNDAPGRKAMASCELGVAGSTAAEKTALVQQLWTGSTMDRTVNATAAK
jgi:hypothetical protein